MKKIPPDFFMIFATVVSIFISDWLGIKIGTMCFIGLFISLMLGYYGDDIKLIAFAGTRIELDRKIKEADDLLKKLKEITRLFAEASFCNMAFDGHHPGSIKYKKFIEIGDEIHNQLFQLGLTTEEILALKREYIVRACNTMITKIGQKLKKHNIFFSLVPLVTPIDFEKLINSIDFIEDDKKDEIKIICASEIEIYDELVKTGTIRDKKAFLNAIELFYQ